MAYRKRQRGTTTQRGLGSKHQADGKRQRASLIDGAPCWRCGLPMYRWQKLDLDHVTPRALGGAGGPAVLAHASCNRSAGATLGNRMRGMAKQANRPPSRPAAAIPPPLRTSRAW